MSQGRVLLVEGDELLSSEVARVLSAADYEVLLAYTALAGLEKAQQDVPDCIVCDVDLPDIEGHYVARGVREDASGKVAVIPIVFLASASDFDTALRALRVGGDAWLDKPPAPDALVAQVGALVAMAKRLQERRDSAFPSSMRAAPALRGNLDQMSLATVFMVIEMERRSGRLNVESEDGRKAVFALAAATFTITTLDGKLFDSTSALRLVLTWTKGRFWFVPSEKPEAPNPRGSIGGTILEAIRLNDESAR